MIESSRVVRRVGGAILMLALAGAPALAQTPDCPCPPEAPPPPPVWTGSLGAGFSLTQGNKDTTNLNFSFDVVRDPRTSTVFKANALYILATEDGDRNADRAIANGRVERALGERAYAFGQLAYMRDRFKDVDYLLAPTFGLGYKVIAEDRTSLDVDGSVGLVFEKNTGFDLETSGAFAFGERFAYKISDTATLTQSVSALWKMDEPGDALYTFSAGVAASMTTRTQIKLEFQDVYKTRPTGLGVQKNDIAFLSALVYKF